MMHQLYIGVQMLQKSDMSRTHFMYLSKFLWILKSSDLNFIMTEPEDSGGVCPSRRKHLPIRNILKQLNLSLPQTSPSQK